MCGGRAQRRTTQSLMWVFPWDERLNTLHALRRDDDDSWSWCVYWYGTVVVYANKSDKRFWICFFELRFQIIPTKKTARACQPCAPDGRWRRRQTKSHRTGWTKFKKIGAWSRPPPLIYYKKLFLRGGGRSCRTSVGHNILLFYLLPLKPKTWFRVRASTWYQYWPYNSCLFKQTREQPMYGHTQQQHYSYFILHSFIFQSNH